MGFKGSSKSQTEYRLIIGSAFISGLLIYIAARQSSSQLKPDKTLIHGVSGQAVRALTFSPDKQTIASAGNIPSIELWNAKTGQVTKKLAQPNINVSSIAFSPDGSLLAASNISDKTLQLWSVRTGGLIRTWSSHSTVWAITFSPNGKIIAGGTSVAAGRNRKEAIMLWDVKTGQLIRTLTEHPSQVSTNAIKSIAFSSDGTLLLSGGGTQVRLWTVKTGRLKQTLSRFPSDTNVLFASGGKVAVGVEGIDTSQISDSNQNVKSTSLSEKTCFWNVRNGQLQRTLQMPGNIIQRIALSPDRKILVAGDHLNEVFLWDVQNNKLICTLPNQDYKIKDISFSPDGRILAISREGAIDLWDVKKLK